MIERIDHVNIVVRDLPTMVAFYRDTLGLSQGREVTIGGDWVEVTIEVDKWFTPADIDPASTDTRELGLQVFGLYLAPATSG